MRMLSNSRFRLVAQVQIAVCAASLLLSAACSTPANDDGSANEPAPVISPSTNVAEAAPTRTGEASTSDQYSYRGALSWDELNQQLEALAEYFSFEFYDAEGKRVDSDDPRGYELLVLDTDAALKAGIKPEAIALAGEIAALQNETKVRFFRAKAEGTTPEEIDMNEYPLVNAFKEESSERSGRSSD